MAMWLYSPSPEGFPSDVHLWGCGERSPLSLLPFGDWITYYIPSISTCHLWEEEWKTELFLPWVIYFLGLNCSPWWGRAIVASGEGKGALDLRRVRVKRARPQVPGLLWAAVYWGTSRSHYWPEVKLEVLYTLSFLLPSVATSCQARQDKSILNYVLIYFYPITATEI